MLVRKYTNILNKNGKEYLFSKEYRKLMEQDVYRVALSMGINITKNPITYTTNGIKLNGRIYRTLGMFNMEQPYNIELSKTLYEQGTLEDIVLIVLHEVCHYILYVGGNKGYRDGDMNFEKLLVKVGAPSTGKTTIYINRGYKYKCNGGCELIDTRNFPTGFVTCKKHKLGLSNLGKGTYLVRKKQGE